MVYWLVYIILPKYGQLYVESMQVIKIKKHNYYNNLFVHNL